MTPTERALTRAGFIVAGLAILAAPMHLDRLDLGSTVWLLAIGAGCVFIGLGLGRPRAL